MKTATTRWLLAGSLLAMGTACNAAVDAEPAAEIPKAEAEAAAVEIVNELPLRRGYYVRSETACNQASRADVFALVMRTGMNLDCTFKRIEKTGATTYRVTEECSDRGSAWGGVDTLETFTSTYEIPDESSYTVINEDGYESSARHCEQSDMSPGYRENDIGDLIH